MTDGHKCSADYKALPREIWNINLLWNENLTFYEPNQNELITLWLLQYESALIHQGVLLKLVIFKNLDKMVIFGFIGHDKFNFIIKM